MENGVGRGGGGVGVKNKRAAVWAIISEQRQRYEINMLLLLSHPSAQGIGAFLQPSIPI